jgi:transcriptional antiterminator RfaH
VFIKYCALVKIPIQSEFQRAFWESIKEISSRFDEEPRKIFEPQESVTIQAGPMKGFEATFQEILQQSNGEVRAMVLIDLLGKLQKIELPVSALAKIN